MPLIANPSEKTIQLQLSRDLTRMIKRGHAWVYGNALRQLPKAEPGSKARLVNNRGGKEIAQGYCDPNGEIALRICTTQPGETLNDQWAQKTMLKAFELRRAIFSGDTSGYRLFNGEGDGLPGLVCDIYGVSAVIKFDGLAAESFWDVEGICEWLRKHIGTQSVFIKRRERHGEGSLVFGNDPKQPVSFFENEISFTADLIRGQKTGFYFDQRDNRSRIKTLAADKKVLNAFGYTGGFSVYAGLGRAKHVTTVDLAKPALVAADQHWEINQLDPEMHESIAADVFEFLEHAVKNNQIWEMVILDPPSFAPSESALPQAINAYERMVTLGAKATQKNGILAVSSCSSHVTGERFIKACEEGISKARRKATLFGNYGLPADHPTPLVMPELRYLKFLLLRLD